MFFFLSFLRNWKLFLLLQITSCWYRSESKPLTVTLTLSTKPTEHLAASFNLKATAECWFSHFSLWQTLCLHFFPSPISALPCWSPAEPRCLTFLSQLLSALTQANARRATGPPPWFRRRCWSNRPSELFLLFQKFSTENSSCFTLSSLPPIIANVPLWAHKSALIFMEYFCFRALRQASQHTYISTLCCSLWTWTLTKIKQKAAVLLIFSG